MLNIKRNTPTRKMAFKVTDCDGNSETFPSVADVATRLGCTVSNIYLGIKNNRLVCGCKVESVGKQIIGGIC